MEAKKKLDYEMYCDFIKEYKLDEIGGIRLLRILLNRLLNIESLDNKSDEKFINFYLEKYKEEINND